MLAGHPHRVSSCAGVSASVDRKGLLNLQGSCGWEPGMVGGGGIGIGTGVPTDGGGRAVTNTLLNCLCCPWVKGTEGMGTSSEPTMFPAFYSLASVSPCTQ